MKYILTMCNRSIDPTPIALKMKVFEIARTQCTLFKNKILDDGWLKWFKNYHSELTMKVV